MKVVILCGGQGTRIRDVSENIPKPMIPIGRQPILWHIMKIYSACGFNEFILCLGHKSHVIKEFFLNYYTMVNDITVKSRPCKGSPRARQIPLDRSQRHLGPPQKPPNTRGQ